jgi:hypothetical protein
VDWEVTSMPHAVDGLESAGFLAVNGAILVVLVRGAIKLAVFLYMADRKKAQARIITAYD